MRRACWALCAVFLPVLPLLFRAAGGALRCMGFCIRPKPKPCLGPLKNGRRILRNPCMWVRAKSGSCHSFVTARTRIAV